MGFELHTITVKAGSQATVKSDRLEFAFGQAAFAAGSGAGTASTIAVTGLGGLPVSYTKIAATISNSSASIAITNTAGIFALDTPVTFDATVGTSGGQVVAGTTYYVVSTTATAIQVSATVGGSAITFNAAGTPNVTATVGTYVVDVSPNSQDSSVYVSSKTATGFIINVRPRLAASTLLAGTADWILYA